MPLDTVEYEKRTSRISNPDGSVVFEMNDAEIPRNWSQLATDIMVSKYFRKAGVPQRDEAGNPLRDAGGNSSPGRNARPRKSFIASPAAGGIGAEKHGYFDSAEDAQAFYDELCYMLLHQMCAPNSPQWFNTGLNWAYGITGPAQGHHYCDPKSGELLKSKDAYSHPQPHACFIQSVSDDLVNPGGIMDLWTREARLFKYGSGTGSNFSQLRGENEPLSGGGKSSGLMSFLKIGDRAAGAIKSGGTTRRAAKMVCLDLDHPDIEQFVNWKVREELKVAAMAEGIKRLPPESAGAGNEAGPEARLRFQRRSVHDRQRPEFQQFRPHPQPLFQSGRRRRQLGSNLAHDQEGRQDAQAPAICGNRSPSPRGAAPIPACSTTTRSISGTPAPRAARSRRPTPASPAKRASSLPAASGGESIR